MRHTTPLRTPDVFTAHALQQMQPRGVHPDQVHAAALDAVTTRQASGRLENCGRNGTTYITDPSGEVVITVLPQDSRPAPCPNAPPGCPGTARAAAAPRAGTTAPPPPLISASTGSGR